MKDINKDIENLEEIINLINKELDKKDKNVSAILDLEDLLSLRNLIKAYKELEEENEKLRSDNLEYQRTQDIFDERTYRKKYLEERRKEEPNLLYPDSDEIYKRYYKLKEENATLKKAHNISENVTIQDITNVMNKSLEDFNKEYIPVSLVEEKMEELKEEIEQLRIESNITYDSGIYRNQIKIDILQELLERRK